MNRSINPSPTGNCASQNQFRSGFSVTEKTWIPLFSGLAVFVNRSTWRPSNILNLAGRLSVWEPPCFSLGAVCVRSWQMLSKVTRISTGSMEKSEHLVQTCRPHVLILGRVHQNALQSNSWARDIYGLGGAILPRYLGGGCQMEIVLSPGRLSG